jgi:hypothetical protein
MLMGTSQCLCYSHKTPDDSQQQLSEAEPATVKAGRGDSQAKAAQEESSTDISFYN